jgi:hypothetical protein
VPVNKENTMSVRSAIRGWFIALLLAAGGSLPASGADGVAASTGAIGPGFTGSWFDPAESGHGLFIQVLPDNRFLAAWLTFSPAGAQAWLFGDGSYSGNTATLTLVEQPSGGQWIPLFNGVSHVRWGTLTFTFTDCHNGRVDFNSTAGYGTGSMALTRLTLPAGLTCE